ncbi:MAG: ABC transporter ATP-binding protein [Chloroflexi bacterium]|nr:MAG: ABC transporter ATP-binding protein [Chloroflexota bacterium]
MSILVIENVSKSYGAELILDGVSFRVESRDRIGLVGANGSGKTTLLKLLAQQLVPDQGTITYQERLSTGYLPQLADFHPSRTLYQEMLTVFAGVQAWEEELAEIGRELGDASKVEQPEVYSSLLERYAELQESVEHAGGYTIEPDIRRVLDGLGFSREQQEAPASYLSGGQQTRAALGKLLLQEPDLLLLDEPTNHLDLEALEWLEGYLHAWRGSMIVVSHDRYFLDRVTTRTLEVANTRLDEYPGNYSKYVRLRGERLARWAKEYEEQQEYIARTEEFIRRYKAGQRSKEARGRQTLLDRMERTPRPPVDQRLEFKIGARIESGQIVLATDGLVAGIPADPDTGSGIVVAVPDTSIERGERIGLLGANGSGKTTLLRTIVGQRRPRAGALRLGHNVQIGYYAQTHEGLRMRSTLVDEIRQVSHLSEEGARSYLGRFLFTGDDVFKSVGSLSGGERSRVALAKLTLEGANFLVLDEPTNHLDLPARQMLEEILAQYDGTMIFVSHDRYFVDALATKLWILEDGTVSVFDGNYTRYRLRQARLESGAGIPIPETRTAAGKTTGVREGSGDRDRIGAAPDSAERDRGRARTVGQVEAEISSLEARIGELERLLALASAETNVGRISELALEYQEVNARLESLYEEWQELAG